MNWRRVICWLRGHNWEVLEGKRHCVFCDYVPEDDDVNFCPECGSERLRLYIMASDGYQYVQCMKCEHMFQDTSECSVTVAFGDDCYELDKPEVDQDGDLIKEEIEE